MPKPQKPSLENPPAKRVQLLLPLPLLPRAAFSSAIMYVICSEMKMCENVGKTSANMPCHMQNDISQLLKQCQGLHNNCGQSRQRIYLWSSVYLVLT